METKVKMEAEVAVHEPSVEPEIKALRAGLTGDSYSPEDKGYEEAVSAWNLNARQNPKLVVMAETAEDIARAVRFACDNELGVGVMATGHGVASLPDGGVLVNTSRMKGIEINSERRTARVEPGVKWVDLIPATQEHGLAGLLGSTSDVSVVGYTMGGGFGWLGRKYGFNADAVVEAEIVTADGELRRASRDENPDLFWGLAGGAGNFGIVASMEFSLYPITTVFGGNLFYPVEKAREVLELYAEWNSTLPDEMTTAATFMNFPPIPEIPEPLRGGKFISVRGCYSGENPEDGEEFLRVWREFGEPAVDTFGIMPYSMMDVISMDPVDPIGAYGHSELLRNLSPETIETLIEVAGAESNSPLILLEVRQLGGALSRPEGELSPMGRSGARFIMNAIGATPFPEMEKAVREYLAYLAEAIRPHQTGATYVNFVDLDSATEERVKAAYSPEDFERLVALKDEYDPENLFRFNRNIPPTKSAK